MLLHLNVVILTTKDAGRLQAISGQKRKQTLTLFYPTKTSGWYLSTRCWTQRVSIGCEPTLLALSQHRLTFFVLPRSSFGIRPLLIFSLLSLRTPSYFLQPLAANVSKLRAFWPSYLCSGIPFHSSNWQTEVFYFEDRSYGTLLVHYFQVKFQLFFAMPCCSILFVLSEQYSLSWRISIVVCPDVQDEGSRVSLEHLQSTVLRRASVTSTSISKIYCPNAIIENSLS